MALLIRLIMALFTRPEIGLFHPTLTILAFAAPKLKMDVNISVLAKPHNPLTKYAVKAAINHRIMTVFSAPFVTIHALSRACTASFQGHPDKAIINS